MSETGLHVYEHPSFRPPQNLEIPIWRYMNFAKFVAMLEYGGLFFSRVDELEDPFEATIPDSSYQQLAANMPEYLMLHSDQRAYLTVNCWHMNEYESAAMWKLYSDSDDVIAIRSTYSRLRRNLANGVFVGIVNYIDYIHEKFNELQFLEAVIHKRRSFEHERELRAIIGYLHDMHKR